MGTSASSYIPQGEDLDSVIQALNYSVVCGIEIQNSTKHNLHSPKTTVQWGYLLSPPPTSIRSGRKGSFVGHKHSAGVTGTTGVVSYLIGTTGLRMVIMWAAPYNFDFFNNYLAVGFVRKHDDDIYDRMYYGKGRNYEFSRDSYSGSCNTVTKRVIPSLFRESWELLINQRWKWNYLKKYKRIDMRLCKKLSKFYITTSFLILIHSMRLYPILEKKNQFSFRDVINGLPTFQTVYLLH